MDLFLNITYFNKKKTTIMSIFIKTGFWIERKLGLNSEFNLTRYITELISDSVAPTLQQVTQSGATTPSNIVVNGLTIGRGGGSVAGNTAIGANTLISNISGINNTFIGENSGYFNTSGTSNVGVGINTLYNNSSVSAIQNTAVGSFSLQNNTAGYTNSAFGYFALNSNLTGYENTAVGKSALQLNTDGLRNTAVGNRALGNNVGGGDNVAIGKDALSTNITGNYNVALGSNARTQLGTNSNSIVIGRGAVGLGSNTTVLGTSSTVLTAIYGQIAIGTTAVVPCAQLQIDSIFRGFLPPRMTTVQINAMTNLVPGLMAYNTTINQLCFFNGLSWQKVTSTLM